MKGTKSSSYEALNIGLKHPILAIPPYRPYTGRGVKWSCVAAAHSTRPYPYQTQKKIIPPSSTHRYLAPIAWVRFTWVFWRCEGGSNPLKVVSGTCSNATCSWAAKVRAKNATPGAQTPNPGYLDQHGGCSSRWWGQVRPLPGYGARLSTLKTTNLMFLHKLSQIAISGISLQPLRHNLAVLHTCKIVGLASADLQLRFTLAKQLSTYDFQNELQTLWLRVLWVQP